MNISQIKERPYGVWLLLYFGALVLARMFPNAMLTSTSFLPEFLSIKVNALTIILTLGLLYFVVVIHTLVIRKLLVAEALREIFLPGFFWLFIVLGFSSSPAGLIKVFAFSLVLGWFEPDIFEWAVSMLKKWKKR